MSADRDLLQELDSPSIADKDEALKMLYGSSCATKVTDKLLGFLKGSDSYLSGGAVAVIQEMDWPEFYLGNEFLHLLADTNPEVRANALACLTRVFWRRSLPLIMPIAQLVFDEDRTVRTGANHLLLLVDEPILFDYLNVETKSLRYWVDHYKKGSIHSVFAVLALQFYDSEGKRQLLKCSDTPTPGISDLALRLFRRLRWRELMDGPVQLPIGSRPCDKWAEICTACKRSLEERKEEYERECRRKHEI